MVTRRAIVLGAIATPLAVSLPTAFAAGAPTVGQARAGGWPMLLDDPLAMGFASPLLVWTTRSPKTDVLAKLFAEQLRDAGFCLDGAAL